MAGSLFRTKSIDRLIADSAETGAHSLKRTLGPWSLVALGIGAIIGAGLFVILAVLVTVIAFMILARDRVARWCFAPYALWLSYATCLNAGILVLN